MIFVCPELAHRPPQANIHSIFEREPENLEVEVLDWRVAKGS